MLYEFRDLETGRIVTLDRECVPVGEVIEGRYERIFSIPALARHTMARDTRKRVKGYSLPRKGHDVVDAPHYDAAGVACFDSKAERDAYCARRSRAGVPTEYVP